MTPDLLPERIAAKVAVAESGCWLWTAAKQEGGYGVCKWDGKGQPAHRVTYTLLVGPIPAGHDIDHDCFVRACVNPAHLTPRTHAANCQRRSGPNRPRVQYREGERPPHNPAWPVSYGSYAGRGCRCVGCFAAMQTYKANRRAA